MARLDTAAPSHLGPVPDHLAIRRIGPSDLKEALREGFADFWATPTHLVFLGLLYPLLGIFFAGVMFGYNMLPLLFPIMSGFALVGPLAAIGLYQSLFGWHAPESMGEFVREVFTTQNGWWLIIAGNALGFVFSAVVFCISVVSFPLLLDRDVGAIPAVLTSIRAVAANPGTMLLWALIVATALVIGFIPLFIGLAVVLPVLGHATW